MWYWGPKSLLFGSLDPYGYVLLSQTFSLFAVSLIVKRSGSNAQPTRSHHLRNPSHPSRQLLVVIRVRDDTGVI